MMKLNTATDRKERGEEEHERRHPDVGAGVVDHGSPENDRYVEPRPRNDSVARRRCNPPSEMVATTINGARSWQLRLWMIRCLAPRRAAITEVGVAHLDHRRTHDSGHRRPAQIPNASTTFATCRRGLRCP